MTLSELERVIAQTPYEVLEEVNSKYEQCHLCRKRQPMDIMTIKVDASSVLDQSNPDNGVYVCDFCTTI